MLMPKLFHPNARRSLSLLAGVFGLLALMVAPSIATAHDGNAQRKGLRAAQTVMPRTVKGISRADRDRDGLTNWTEVTRTRTNPYKFDTDGDRFGDGTEVAAGSDPRNRASVPTSGSPVPPPVPPVSVPPMAPPTPPGNPAPPADTTAPDTVIDSGPSGDTTSTSASFGFFSSETGSTFQCRLDSGSWGGCASPKGYSSVAVGDHTFSVRATDGAGNTDVSPASRGWTVDAPAPPPDTTAPDTTIDSGPSATTTSTSASFGFSSTEGGSSFQCRLDSGSWGACTSPKAYSSVAVGGHTFSVRATDGSDNTDASPATRSWTVEAPAPPTDTTPPNTMIASGPSGSTTSTSASFGFSSTEGGSSFQCRLDSGSWGSCASPKGYSSVAVDDHTFSVRASDGAGNVDPSPATQSWTVEAPTPPADTTAPDTTIDSGPSGTTTSTSASFGFSSSEGGSTFQCRLDSGSWGTCTSPRAYSSVAAGDHTFSVRATDGSDNTDASPATRGWTVQSEGGGGTAGCTQTLSSGSLSTAISNAASGAVICLNGGSWSFNLSQVSKSSYVTVQSSSGQTASLGYSILNKSKYLRFQNLKFTGGVEMIGSSNHIEFRDNEFTGDFGIRANGEAASGGTKVTDVVIDGNNIHNIDYTGSQGTADGYGITLVNGVERFTITDNTIKSVAADYIQSASPVDFTVDHNTFLGPSLVANHPQEHQDLWQIFGGGKNITYTNNIARNTGTHESLLFQEGSFSNVVITNNLFDHDSRGYTCQLYQSTGMIFRNNTIVGSHWGCLFRDLASSSPGSGYQVDHNVFADTEADVDVSTEGRAGNWGTYDYNVSSDGSANGSHSVRNWSPSWVDTVNYAPKGLPFSAGYAP
jgi:hypothetical protein